jgi:predicted 2-oxoglutarate/Fe(II)-dependent dioxygenase YbiX
MYLTDPDNYEGGEIHFPRQNITLKPKPGEIIYFPSCYTHVHEVKPVTKGERYVILTILS